jgi:hypothetical protein
MGSTLKGIARKPSSLGVTLCILVYLSVYIFFSLCHQLAYQVFLWLEDVNGVFSLLRIHRRYQSSYTEYGFRRLGHLLTRGLTDVFRWLLSGAINQ